MNKPKGPFSRLVIIIKQKLDDLETENQRYGGNCFASRINEYRTALRVLEDWPKWEPLIEAAGKLTTEDLDWLRARVHEIAEYAPIKGYICPGKARKNRFRALLEALPDELDEEKEREREAYLRNMDEPGPKEEERK